MITYTRLIFSVEPEFAKEFEKEAERLRVELKSKRGCKKELLQRMWKKWIGERQSGDTKAPD